MPRPIKIDWANLADPHSLERPFPGPERIFPGMDEIDPETFPEFLDEIGLIGMGGGGFQTSKKVRASMGAHTLVINGVECEPGITIDQSILLHDSLWVSAGANACAKAIGAKRIVLAVKRDDPLVAEIRKRNAEYDIVLFSGRYPAGAERLILEKLTGNMPPPDVRPFQLGYLVLNVVSLRAIGRALIDGIPVVERPLTLAMPSTGFYKNIIVPVGQTVQEVLAAYHLPYDPSLHLLVDSGLMMGREVEPNDPVEKTTLSLLVIQREKAWKEERPCIRCGACNTACPLGLHPFSLTERIRTRKTTSTAFKAQMAECFLCGVCSAACPSDIPLVHLLKEGKQCR
ncbi:Electron transport complex subunit RnfC [Pontiella desulfatans]|uniref:Electron transport complex subunit RnfC n=1 Tax=Pontiella desulfatans TaxID=2750659 RepID=A0A6C2U624_PONDE|nr:4Fe-4S dicluster domain-containing protein [Pontiella desulfatans]VGO15299.1 Electron transport complex subunit RnfC [Pontiella desulfatans]